MNTPAPAVARRDEEYKDWIETALDADAHGSWHNAPNFDVIQQIAELLAPRFAKHVNTLLQAKQVEIEEAYQRGIQDGAVNPGERRRILEQMRAEVSEEVMCGVLDGMKVTAEGAERMALDKGWIDNEPHAYNQALADAKTAIKNLLDVN